MGGRDSEFGMDMYTLLYLKWITNKDLLHRTWNSAQCYVAGWKGGKLGGEWRYMCVCVCVYLIPFTVHLKLSQYFHRLYPKTKLKVKKNSFS